MKIKIDGREFNASARPKDVDAQVTAALGVTAAEVPALLADTPLGGHVAQALLPFLPEGDRPAPAELAAAIVREGVRAVAADVARLYVAANVQTPPSPAV